MEQMLRVQTRRDGGMMPDKKACSKRHLRLEQIQILSAAHLAGFDLIMNGRI
jgi:hypothetical protein